MLFKTTKAVSVGLGTHWEYIPDGDEVSINVGQISEIYPNLPDAISLTPALNGAKESCFIALSGGKRYLLAQSYAEVRSEVEQLQKPDIIRPPERSVWEKVGDVFINLAVKEIWRLIMVGVAAAVILLLAACSTSVTSPTVTAPQEPAAIPTATVSPTLTPLADTPTTPRLQPPRLRRPIPQCQLPRLRRHPFPRPPRVCPKSLGRRLKSPTMTSGSGG